MVYYFFVLFILTTPIAKADQIEWHGDFTYTHSSNTPMEITVSKKGLGQVQTINLPVRISGFRIYRDVLYGISTWAHAIVCLNLATRQVDTVIQVNHEPSKVFFIGDRIFIVYREETDIGVIDIETQSVIKTIGTQLQAPPEFSEFNSTHFFVAGSHNHVVVMINLKTLVVQHIFECRDTPQGSHICGLQMVQEAPWVIVADTLKGAYVGYQLFTEDLVVGPKIAFFNSILYTNIVGDSDMPKCITGSELQTSCSMRIDTIYIFFVPPMAYVFNVRCPFIDVVDLKSGHRVGHFYMLCPRRKFYFTSLSLYTNDQLEMPLYPTVSLFKMMLKENKLGQYATYCGGRLQKPKSLGTEILSKDDSAFFKELSSVAALSQEQIYLYLSPLEALYALTKTKDNGFLKSGHWTELRKGVLMQVCRSLWGREREKAKVYIGLLMDLKDPAVDLFTE